MDGISNMSKIAYTTRDEYFSMVKALEGGHWTPDTIDSRWDYHYRAIELIKAIGLNQPNEVIEMGTMGVCCVKHSDTIDYSERWDFPCKNPTYLHDAKNFPWPIKDKQYEVFVALRVFQHLFPCQRESIQEAMRIAKRVIVVVPSVYDVDVFPMSKGITYSDFVKFLDGIHPNLYLPTAQGMMYYWDTQNPSILSLEKVMESTTLVKYHNVITDKQKSNLQSLLKRIKNKIKRILKLS
ncbi:MAG: hypothetical protein AB4041_21010 [Microcystaceae cyanobacterium]